MSLNLKTVVGSMVLALFLITAAHVSLTVASASWQGPGSIGLLPPGECDSQGRAGALYVNGINCRIVMVDGYPRNYIVYLPPSGLRDPAPVVFMFHGASGTGAQYLNISGWREKADEEGLVAVFPTGAIYCKSNAPCENGGRAGWTTRWHDYSLRTDPDLYFEALPPAYPVTSDWPANDVRFVRRMLADLIDPATGVYVDRNRIYASGFSNGANFTARLAVELDDQLAAVGYVAGGLTADGTDVSTPTTYIPVYAAFGTNDDRILDRISDEGVEFLPLEPADLFELGEISEEFIRPHLDTFDHIYNPDTFVPYHAYRAETYTLFGWRTTSIGGSRHIFKLAILSGLQHKYPNGCAPQETDPKNPECFQASERFWRFFERHSRSDMIVEIAGDRRMESTQGFIEMLYLPAIRQ